PSDSLQASVAENEKQRVAAKPAERQAPAVAAASLKDRLWTGWVLPASEADVWLASGAPDYHQVLSSDQVERTMAARRAAFRNLKLSPQNEANRYRIEDLKGVMFLDGLRRKMGDDAFLKLMSAYFNENTTKTVTARSFLEKAGVPYADPDPGEG